MNSTDIRELIRIPLLIERLSTMSGVKFSEDVRNFSSEKQLLISDHDIVAIKSRWVFPQRLIFYALFFQS